MHFVAVFGLPQLVVGLGSDVLVAVLFEVIEFAAGNMPRVEEVRGAETIL